MKAYIQYSTHRAPSDANFHMQPVYSVYTVSVPVKLAPMRHHEKGLSWTATGYGSRIPTEFMVQVNGKWRRVYCRIYSNNGTTYIGKLNQFGERAIVQIEGV